MPQLSPVGMIGRLGSSGGGVASVPEPFPVVFDGKTLPLQIDYDRQLFYFNSTIYTSAAAFQAATGGATVGSGRVPIASLGAAPWTFQFTGQCPATINASRNYAFSWYGGVTNLAYVRLDQATNNSQYTVINGGATQAAITNPVASSLGSEWSCAGVLGSNIGRYASIGRDPGTPDTVLSLPAFNTGIALGYNPAAANGEWRGIWRTLTVWNGDLGSAAVRALSTNNLYGPSRTTLSGNGRMLNSGGYTYVNSVGSDGAQICVAIRNDNRQMVGIKALATGLPQDDHNVASMVDTDDGGRVAVWTNHDTGNVVYFSKAPDRSLDSFPFRSTFTIGSGYIPAYGTLRKRASNGHLFFFFRTDQTFWNVITSTDHGATWAHVGTTGRFLDDSASGGDKVLVTAIREVSDGVFRCMANREPQYLATEVRIFDLNMDTLDITSASGSVGTIGTGNGAVMGDCGTVWNPPSGYSAFLRDFKVWNQGLAGLLNESTGSQDYYWLYCTNPAAPFVSSSWAQIFLINAGASGKAAGGCVIGIPDLPTPRLWISRYDAGAELYRLEEWQAGDTDGTTWSVTKEIASGGDSGDNKLRAPSSPDDADPEVPGAWLLGDYANYDDYAQQAYWLRTVT